MIAPVLLSTGLGLWLAHPLTEPFQLPVSPVVAACAAAALVLAVSQTWPEARRRSSRDAEDAVTSWEGSLSASQLIGRWLAVALLFLVIAAGRLGADDELENLASALVVGAAWPLLVLASIVVGPVWRWLDPWDAVARTVTRDERDERPDHVWPAVLVALPWVWYLSAYWDTLSPRSVGLMVALYTLFTVAGCLLIGRRRWLGSAEPLGIVLSWMALLPRGRLTGRRPPRGAEALIGVLAGGVLFGAVRRSELWGELNTAEDARLFATLGVVAASATAAGFCVWITSRSRPLGASGAFVRAAAPALAGIIVAVALDRNRLTTSVQLLPGLLGDPLGRGWDLFGDAGGGLDPAPFGTRGLLLVQLGVLVAGHVVGAVVLARGAPRRARGPASVGLAVLAAASVIAVVSH